MPLRENGHGLSRRNWVNGGAVVCLTPFVALFVSLSALFALGTTERLELGIGLVIVIATTLIVMIVCCLWVMLFTTAWAMKGRTRKLTLIVGAVLSAAYVFFLCIKPLTVNDNYKFGGGSVRLETVSCTVGLRGEYSSVRSVWPNRSVYDGPFVLNAWINFGGRPDLASIVIDRISVTTIGKVQERPDADDHPLSRAEAKRSSWSTYFASMPLRLPHLDCEATVVMKWRPKAGLELAKEVTVHLILNHRRFLSNNIFDALMSV
jgi:hypothetical protein